MYISKKATNFSSFKGVAQKLCLPCPLEVWNSFGRKSILSAARGTKFGEKLILLSATTGENLVLISQTTFEKSKIESFPISIPSLVGQKILFKNYFITSWGINWKDKTVNFEFLRDGLRYHHQIFTSCQTLWEPALYQIWRL